MNGHGNENRAQGLAVEADQAGDGFHRVVIPVGRRVAGYLKHTVSQKLQRDKGAAEEAEPQGDKVGGDILPAPVLDKVSQQEGHAKADKQIAYAVEQDQQDQPDIRSLDTAAVKQERHGAQHQPCVTVKQNWASFGK